MLHTFMPLYPIQVHTLAELPEVGGIELAMDIRVDLPGGNFVLLTVSNDATIADVCAEVAVIIDSEHCDLVCTSGSQLLLPVAVVGLLVDRQLHISRISDPPREDWRLESVDVKQQQAILERIRQKRIAENQEAARRLNLAAHSPGIRMLICRISGISIRMIVDTGSSASILYANHVTTLGLNRLVDVAPECRLMFATVAADATSIGMIHNTELVVGDVVTRVSLAILPGEGAHGLLGIDWLAHNHAIINTAKSCITIQGKSIQFAD
jgi:hypothetical protein